MSCKSGIIGTNKSPSSRDAGDFVTGDRQGVRCIVSVEKLAQEKDDVEGYTEGTRDCTAAVVGRHNIPALVMEHCMALSWSCLLSNDCGIWLNQSTDNPLMLVPSLSWV